MNKQEQEQVLDGLSQIRSVFELPSACGPNPYEEEKIILVNAYIKVANTSITLEDGSTNNHDEINKLLEDNENI